MRIPLNRVVAFAGPYLSVLAGGLASWLVARVNIAGIPGLDEHNLQTAIAGGLAWLLVAGLTWAGHSKWLTGHHMQLESDGRVTAAAMTAVAATPTTGAAPDAAATSGNGFHPRTADAVIFDELDDPNADAVDDDDVVSDEVEFASPPTPANYTPADPEPAS